MCVKITKSLILWIENTFEDLNPNVTIPPKKVRTNKIPFGILKIQVHHRFLRFSGEKALLV
jgi:hypothetical protein